MEEATQRRYLEGFFAGLHARGAGAVVGGRGSNGYHPAPSSPALPPNPWRALLACAEGDRPPGAGERAGLRTLGVVDLGPEGRDGCRLQLRATPGGRLQAWQLRELAAVSQECAGGFIEIGAGGGPELAVVGWREAAGALARLRAVGLTGGNHGLWCSPAAGLDAAEVFDVTPLALTLDGALEAVDGLRVVLVGGARGGPERVEEALHLRAVAGAVAGEIFFQVMAGGTCLRVPAGKAATAVMLFTEKFRQHGGWRGLNVEELREALDGSSLDAPELSTRVDPGLSPGTMFPQRQPGLHALVARGPADSLWRSRALGALAGFAEAEGSGEARLWAGGVLVPRVAEGRAANGLERLAEITALVR